MTQVTHVARSMDHRYRDPLEEIWLGACARMGLRVERSDRVYASFDGAGLLTIGTPETLDRDDCLAQIIFHELCHGLVASDADRCCVDWGMGVSDGHDRGDQLREYACHRLQAALAQAHGLRRFMAVTTDHRTYWDGLPADPLADCPDPALPLARIAHDRALHGPWAGPIQQALEATGALARLVAPVAAAGSLWRLYEPD